MRIFHMNSNTSYDNDLARSFGFCFSYRMSKMQYNYEKPTKFHDTSCHFKKWDINRQIFLIILVLGYVQYEIMHCV